MMNGTVLQLISIVSYGNDFLINGHETDFTTNNVSFKNCYTVDFRSFKKDISSEKWEEIIIAANANEWFKQLKNEGCKKLRLFYQHSKDQSKTKDYKISVFVGGGGEWYIEAIYDKFSNFWATRWKINKEVSNKWLVWFAVFAREAVTKNVLYDEDITKDYLKQTLISISEFAMIQKLEYWVKQFDSALEALTNLSPKQNSFCKEIIPIKNYSLSSQQLLFTAEQAWVFGGMGSWNDVGFSDIDAQEKYETLS